ncbi:MAG: DegT/DnrJ/EryC1/StrS family aminotransferase, partial [Rhodanobacter sp.]
MRVQATARWTRTRWRELGGSDTLAIVRARLAGLVADMDSVLAVAQACGAWVIEDAAQALGACDVDHSVGLRGDIGFFSLAAGKGLSIYEGGLLLARDPDLRAALGRTHAAMVPHRFGWELRRSLELLGLAATYRPAGLGLAYGRPLRHALRRGDPVAAVGDEASQAGTHDRQGVAAVKLAPWRPGPSRRGLRAHRTGAIPARGCALQ